MEEVRNLVAAVVYFERHSKEDELKNTIKKIEELLSGEDFNDVK
ncbi:MULTISPECIES: hypothetical protein [unclassified Oceanispirochaeta]|nr:MULTISPECIES: hypothetical protein [unclassified Oceanispirochaeta]